MSDYTMTNQEFICAAGSYLGLPGEQLMQGSKLETQEDGALEIVIRLALTPEDMIGIGKRMEAMREMSTNAVDDYDPLRDAMEDAQLDLDINANREAYSSMTPRERSAFGSFGIYLRMTPKERAERLGTAFSVQSEGISGRKVSHIDAPEEEENHPHVDGAVWLSTGDTNDAQRTHASDCRINPDCAGDFQYLVQWSMLTEEQRQKAKEAKP